MPKGNRFIWKRIDISSCSCDDKPYRHVHCPCLRCNGRATDRKTELRHWKETSKLEKEDLRLQRDTYQLYSVHDDEVDIYDQLPSSENNVPHDHEPLQTEQNVIGTENYENAIDLDLDQTDGGYNPLKRIVVKAVLDALKIKYESGASVKTFNDVLEYGKQLLFTSLSEDIDADIILTLWPKNWNDVIRLLKEEGYKDAKEYFICFCSEEKEFKRNGLTTKKTVYSGTFSVMENNDDECTHCGSCGSIKYMYLGLKNKVKNWFRNRTLCEKMLASWLEKDHWLGTPEDFHLKKEIWDGKRWHELQWFWDPDSIWTLPTRCLHCGIPIKSDHIINSPDNENGLCKVVECPVCFEEFEYCIKMAKGSPLNIALIGHFDGWQPFGTSYRGSGSFEVAIANLKKSERNKVEEVYVLGFVPCFQIPNLPNKLDPFLQPLMNDLCEGFIEGYRINYQKGINVPGYQLSEEEIVRILLLVWTADHPGQCETSKFLNQGKCACRRCKLVGQHIQDSANTHFYYGQNRYHFRHPWEERDIESELGNIFDIENESRSSVRKRMASEKGLTGESILHKYLYPLYGFNILYHQVFDVYHTIPLNVVKNQLSRALELEMVDKAKFDKQIKVFPWTTEFKDGRLPKEIGKDCKGIGYWKAESFQKFSFPMAECLMEGQLSDPKEFEILSLVSRLTEIHFHTGRNGWTRDLIEFHKKIAWRLNIQVEEVQGLGMCTISLHNLLHIHQDIINFSASDNVWCAVYERAVKEYVKKSHNGKNIEVTFAHLETIREYLKPVEDDNKASLKEPHIISQRITSSVETARLVTEKKPDHQPKQALLIGSASNIKPLGDQERGMVAMALSVPEWKVPCGVFVCKKCLKPDIGFNGTVFACGETIIVLVDGKEIVVQLQGFWSVQNGDSYTLLGCGVCFLYSLLENGLVDTHYWSGFVKVLSKPLPDSIIFNVDNILRKVFLYPYNDTNFTVVDYMRQIGPSQLTVPVYPEKYDMVVIQGEAIGDVWYGHIQTVDHIEKTIEVYFFVPSRNSENIYIRETCGRRAKNTVSWNSIIRIAQGHWRSQSYASWIKSV